MVLDIVSEAAPLPSPKKVQTVLPKSVEEKNVYGEAVAGEAFLAALAEQSKNPRELWPLDKLRQENEALAASIARLKEEARENETTIYSSWPAVDDPYRNYAAMGVPSYRGWEQVEDPVASANAFISPMTDNSAGFSGPTSMMMRNIPNNYTRLKLLELLAKEGFHGTFDFFYLPIDLKKKNGLGYAFLNFVNHECATAFQQHFDGFSNWVATSGKVCQVTFSDRIQGLEAHVERYRNSAIMHSTVPDDFKPMLFQNGVQIPFPPPTKYIPAPQER